jgi:hypothetical protein
LKKKKKFIVEQDSRTAFTESYAVLADSLEEAIELVASGELEPFQTRTYGYGEDYEYEDSHEAEGEELDLFPE